MRNMHGWRSRSLAWLLFPLVGVSVVLTLAGCTSRRPVPAAPVGDATDRERVSVAKPYWTVEPKPQPVAPLDPPPGPVEPTVEPEKEAPAQLPAVEEAEVDAEPPPAPVEVPYGGSRRLLGTTMGSGPAAAVLTVTTRQGPHGTVVEIRGDGVLSYGIFRLTEPDRLVIDLEGVENRVDPGDREVGMGPLTRIRTAVFQVEPSPVARVVLDLEGEVDVGLEGREGTLRIVLLL